MISYESEIFTRIATRLRSEFEDVFVANTLNLNPAKFPCVFIEEADNYIAADTSDTGSIENHAVVMYEINVITNKQSGKKQQAKEIMSVIDEELLALNFRRQTLQPYSMADSTKYRLVSRYRALTDKNKVFYRR